MIAARTHQLQLASLSRAPVYASNAAENVLSTPRPSSPVSLDTHRSFQGLGPDVLVQLDADIQRLAAATLEYNRIRSEVEAKLHAFSPDQYKSNTHDGYVLPSQSEISLVRTPNESRENAVIENDLLCDADFQRKEDLLAIADLIVAEDSNMSQRLDGLLLLGVFLDENKESLNWDGLQSLFLELMRLIPNADSTTPLPLGESNDTPLILDAVCFCIGLMCRGSLLLQQRAQELGAVQRIMALMKYASSSS
jgi:hypothetical protein